MCVVRICRGRRFQADGAATEKELFESWCSHRAMYSANVHPVLVRYYYQSNYDHIICRTVNRYQSTSY